MRLNIQIVRSSYAGILRLANKQGLVVLVLSYLKTEGPSLTSRRDFYIPWVEGRIR